MGVPIKTTVSANVLEEALNGCFTIRPLKIGTSVSGKVPSQLAGYKSLILLRIYFFGFFYLIFYLINIGGEAECSLLWCICK